MPIEPNFDNIDALEPANPFDTDNVSEGDDHLRGIKNALKANVTGDATETRLLVGGNPAAVQTARALDLIPDVDDQPQLLRFRNAGNDATNISLRTDVAGALFLENEKISQNLQLIVRGAGDDQQTQIAAEPDGAASMGYAGGPAISSAGTGALIQAQPGQSSANISLQDASGGFAQISKQDGGLVSYRNLQPGAAIRLETRNTGDTAAVLALEADEDKTTLYANGGSARITTASDGMQLRSGAAFARLSFINTSGSLSGYIQGSDSGALVIEQLNASQPLDLRVASAIIARCDPTANTFRTYTDGQQMTQTATLAQRSANNSGMYIADADGDLTPAGYNLMPLASTTGASRALTPSDVGKTIRSTGVGGYTYTLDNSLPVGAVVVMQNGANAANTIVPGSGVSLRWFSGVGVTLESSVSVSQGGVATIYKVASSSYDVWGSGLS